jgi:hypothetical protein
MVNVYVNESYVLRSTKEIGVNQELFMDYNHDVDCSFCRKDQKLHNISLKKEVKCKECNKKFRKGNLSVTYSFFVIHVMILTSIPFNYCTYNLSIT